MQVKKVRMLSVPPLSLPIHIEKETVLYESIIM